MGVPQPNPPRTDAMEYYASPDPFDKFPWTFSLYAPDDQPHPDHRRGFISTPNGQRPDGSMHTYWSVVSDLWEPIGVIICKAVNAEAARRFGTPNPSSVYVDEWRDSLAAAGGVVGETEPADPEVTS